MEKSYIFKLSDPGTKKQFGRDQVTFISTAIYHFNKTVAYRIVRRKKKVTLLLVLKTCKDRILPKVYYLDLKKSFKDHDDLLCLLNTWGNDFADHIEVTLRLKNGAYKNVVWHKIPPTHHVNNKKNRQIAEYHTKDRDFAGSSCLIYWMGDNKSGTIEIWYGQEINENEYFLKNPS
jgi:hypothetical protein